MYAIIATGGKQYTVSEGDTIRVEKLAVNAGDTVTFDQVLFVNNGEAKVGEPTCYMLYLIIYTDNPRKERTVFSKIVRPLRGLLFTVYFLKRFLKLSKRDFFSALSALKLSHSLNFTTRSFSSLVREVGMKTVILTIISPRP